MIHLRKIFPHAKYLLLILLVVGSQLTYQSQIKSGYSKNGQTESQSENKEKSEEFGTKTFGTQFAEIKRIIKGEVPEVGEVRGSNDEEARGGQNNKDTNPTSTPTQAQLFTPSPTTPITTVSPTSTPGSTSTPVVNSCIASGGSYNEFPNSCGDSCILAQYPGEIACLDVMTTSCDCGADKCWTGSSCVANPSIVKPTGTPSPVCGNGICEQNEYIRCPSGSECIWIGSCPQDCNISEPPKCPTEGGCLPKPTVYPCGTCEPGQYCLDMMMPCVM